MTDGPGSVLAPRNVVAQAVWRRLAANTNPVNDLVVRYLVISAFCRMARVGPAFDPIPLRPVVHYHMNGVAVDTAGRRMIESL
jgi:L-aspartate oxidase